MMQDLAMHTHEIVMNSLEALSTLVTCEIKDSAKENEIQIHVTDNGKGMSEELVKKVTNPFTTGRKTRKIGLGLAFLKGLTEQCNGTFSIQSEIGKGTKVYASCQRDHLDLPPMGNFGEMLMTCIQANPKNHLIFRYQTDDGIFELDTDVLKEYLGPVELDESSVLIWIRDYINEGIKSLKEGQNEKS